ncbi:MAG: putative Ig domain-containing protein, partial [Marmoricola sp.]
YSRSVTVTSLGTNPGSTPAPTISTTSLPDATRAVQYSTTLAHTGGAGTWSVPVGTLPAGLTLAPATGVISGTPTAGGEADFTVKFTETSSGLSATKALSIAVTPLPTITTTTLPDATRGTPYTTTLQHTGDAGTWTLATSQQGADGMPAGLSLDSATGTISGTVTGPTGTYGIYPVFTETRTGRQAIQALALTVVGQDVAITTTSVPDGTTGTAYSQQLAKTGGAGTFSLKQGTLPPGITLSDTGLLSGTPTAVGDYGFTVTFTETSTGISDNQPLLLHVSAPGSPVINTTSLPDATLGQAYTATLSAVGTGTWSIVYQVPPPGITLNGTTGVLSGTPTHEGDYVFIVKFTTATGSNTKALNIHVNPAPAG